MKKLACAIALAVELSVAGPANAQNYPARPVTIVVPYAAGGPTDVLARVLAERMRISLGQSVLVENVIGAGGAIGLGRVLRAAPDGYTLSIGNWGTHVGLGAIYRLDFDLLKDFAPVALLPANPMLIVTKKDVPANDLKTLIGWLKANESKVSVGTSGVGGASHVAGVFFQNEIGAHFQFVPYRGAGPAMNDLVAGQIVLMVDAVPNSLQHVRPGAIKAFAVEGGAVRGHRLLKTCGAALALAKPPKRNAEIGLGRGPVERDALAGPFLEGGAIGGHRLLETRDAALALAKRQGRLVACEGAGRRVTREDSDGATTVIASSFQGRRLNRPNDVVVKSDGAIYFSDPNTNMVPDQTDITYAGVYRVSPDLGTLTLLVDDFITPNGLAFSPDESVLYINDSRRRHIRAFDMAPNGTLARQTDRVFADLAGPESGVPDGMKVDSEDRDTSTRYGSSLAA
jgi:tripartite-type tricarboxylate transporter receptor subunit TctC